MSTYTFTADDIALDAQLDGIATSVWDRVKELHGKPRTRSTLALSRPDVVVALHIVRRLMAINEHVFAWPHAPIHPFVGVTLFGSGQDDCAVDSRALKMMLQRDFVAHAPACVIKPSTFRRQTGSARETMGYIETNMNKLASEMAKSFCAPGLRSRGIYIGIEKMTTVEQVDIMLPPDKIAHA